MCVCLSVCPCNTLPTFLNLNRLWSVFRMLIIYFPVALRSNADNGPHILEIFKSHTKTHRIWWDSSGKATSTLKHTTLTREKHPLNSAGFESTISAGERPQTYELDRAATGTGDDDGDDDDVKCRPV